MQEALKLLCQSWSQKHKIAVIGDMRELGLSSKLAHKQLADWVDDSCDEVLLFMT